MERRRNRQDRTQPACCCRRRGVRCHERRIDNRRGCVGMSRPQPLRHRNLRTMLTVDDRMVGSIAVHALMHMQKIRMTQLHRPRMGVDERRHCLQGNDEPEHQQAVKSVRHSRIRMLRKVKGHTTCRLQDAYLS